jgi:hypothetical protein
VRDAVGEARVLGGNDQAAPAAISGDQVCSR